MATLAIRCLSFLKQTIVIDSFGATLFLYAVVFPVPWVSFLLKQDPESGEKAVGHIFHKSFRKTSALDILDVL